MKLSFTIGKREFSIGATKSSPDTAGWLRGDDVDMNAQGAKMSHPYSQSTWVYVAINTLARNVSQVPFHICSVSATAVQEMAAKRRKLRAMRRGKANASHLRDGILNYRAFRKRVMMDNIVDSGPVVDLFKQPHPTMDRSLYWQSIMTWRLLRGEFFIVPLDNNDQPVRVMDENGRAASLRLINGPTGRVARLITLSPDLFWHMVVGYTLEGWRYTGSPLMTPIPSQILSPDEVIHGRTPNPVGFYWRGMSPITIAWVAAATDYAAGQFMKGLMMNNADTGVIVSTEQQLSDVQQQQLLAALRERKRMAGTADRPLLLWGGAKVDKPTVSSADMQFIENRKLTREEIAAIFNVPMSLMGITERQQSLGGGPGQEQERLTFMESCVAPHCRDLEAAHDPVVKSFDPSFECYFNLDDLPIFQEARRNRLDAATKAFAMGVPLNQIIEAYDLGFEEQPWGDVGYLPFSLQAVGADPDTTPPENPSDPNAPAGEDNSPPPPGDPNEPQQNLFARALTLFQPRSVAVPAASSPTVPAGTHHCQAPAEYEAYLRSREKRTLSKFKRFVFEQRGRVLKRLPSVINQQFVLSKAGEKVWWTFRSSAPLHRGLDDLWDAADELNRLVDAMKPLWTSDLSDGAKAVFSQIGLDPETFSLPPSEAISYMGQRRNVMSSVNDTTWSQVRAALQAGLQEGDTMDELRARISQAFQGISDGRATVVALTETTAATNAGKHLAMQQAKVPRKGWGTSGLENTRETHLANANLSEDQNGIPIDEPWPNGCLFPGDPNAEPGETINCRCYGFAILDKS